MFYSSKRLLYFDIFEWFSMNLKITVFACNFFGKMSLVTDHYITQFFKLFRICYLDCVYPSFLEYIFELLWNLVFISLKASL